MATTTGHEVVIERTIRATPQRIFRALTDAAELEKWFFTEARTDPRVGGSYEIAWQAADDPTRDHTRHGKYLEIVPDRKIVFEWLGAPGEPEDRMYSLRGMRTTVAITLTPEGDSTRLRLVHTGFPDTEFGREMGTSHTGGWTFYTANLERYLTGGEDLRAAECRQKVK